MKNIPKPVRVYKVPMEPGDAGKTRAGAKTWKKEGAFVGAIILILCATAFAAWHFYFRPSPVEVVTEAEMAFPLPDKPSIAVLPFDNMSGDPKQEYFSDGMTEQIISSLAKVPKLFVIARNSSFTYKGKPVKVQQVARDLGVRYVLEGSVQRSGDRVRITAQLIDATTGNHIWSENYDRDVKDIFALQDDITMKIITAIQVKLTAGEAARIAARGTDNRQAYDMYMKALKSMQVITKDRFHQARKILDEVIALDPSWSMPYSTQAKIHGSDALFRWTTSQLRSWFKAEELVRKALSLDDGNAFAHAQLCNMYLIKKLHEKAIAQGRRAIELGPNLFQAYVELGRALVFSGNPSEAIPVLQTAIRLNPLPRADPYLLLGVAYRDLGQHEKAIAMSKKGLTISPNHMILHLLLASVYSLSDQEENARAETAEVLRINPRFSLEYWARILPYKKKADLDRVVNALRKAGLK